jgi:hypothetical protein
MTDETACQVLKRIIPTLTPGEALPLDLRGGITIYQAVLELIDRVEKLEEASA